MDVKSRDFIEDIIDKVAEKVGRLNLSSGNCGQFTLAIAEYLESKNIESSVGLIYRRDEDIKNIDDLASDDSTIYHVFLIHNSNYYDGTGKIDVNYLVNFSSNEYRDSTPGAITDIGRDNESLHSIVNEQTNWSINKTKFYDLIKDDKPKQKTRNKLKC